ncbi:MAG: radical SAM protein [Myxococcota bacterium]|nr:radical SAM protein [Myxococcota bacterium]
MRVALVNNLYVDQLGYFYIAAALKQAGHDVEFFVTSQNIESELRAFDPGLVGMTAVTGNHLWAASMASEIKEFLPSAKTIMGGPHPTYHPQIIHHPGLDYVCRGEGEVAATALCDALERGEDTFHLPGITARDGDEVHENGFAPLVEELDTVPFPDRSIYQHIKMLRSRNHYPFMLTSRGCPFQCTFCYAPTLAKLTRDAGKFVRFRSVDNVIAEAQELKAEFNVRSVEFVDDIFGMKGKWLDEFAEKWPKEVGLPFQCNLRADLVNDDNIDQLTGAGCEMVAFGVEAGSDRVRNEVLKKSVTTDQIRRAAELLRARGVRFVTYNIVGAPTETWDEAIETLTLNQEIQPDYPQVSIMTPYPGTEVYDYAVEVGQLDSDPKTFDSIEPFNYGSSALETPHREEMANLQKLFATAVRFPRLTPLILRMCKWPGGALYYGIFLAGHALGYYLGVKKVPKLFVLRLVINLGEIWRRHKSGLYKRKLYERSDSPRLKERLESGAGF